MAVFPRPVPHPVRHPLLPGIDVPFTGGSFLITYSGTVKAGIADVTAFLASEEEKAQTVAVDNGLLDKARTRAEALVTSQVKTLLTSAGAACRAVSVTWVEPSAPPTS